MSRTLTPLLLLLLLACCLFAGALLSDPLRADLVDSVFFLRIHRKRLRFRPGRVRLAGEDARHVGEQVFLVVPAGAPAVEEADQGRVSGQLFLEGNPDLAEGEPLLSLLVDSPPVRVPDTAVPA